MKRRRKVILITCSLVVLGLFIGIAWLKANGEFYALDRSGMTLSVGETARHLFSNDVENGVMFVSAQFPKQPNKAAVSQPKALQILKRSSPTWEPIFWSETDGMGPLGIFVERELGEIAIYGDAEEFIFQALIDERSDLKVRYFPERVQFPTTLITMIPEGLNLGEWQFRMEEAFDNLNRFSRCRLPDPHILVEDIAIHSGRLFQGTERRDDDILIYFDSSSKSWQMKKWNPEWPLADWKAFMAGDAENQLDN